MAPETPHSHQPLLLLYPLSYRLPVTMVHKPGFPMMRMPLPQEFKKVKSEKRILGTLAFRVLHRAIRCLRALLSKTVERCGAIMEVLRLAAYPVQAGKDHGLGLVESSGLSPGGGAREQGRETAAQGRNWHLDLKVLDEEEEVMNEEEVMVSNMVTMDVDTALGQRDELDLSWLEWGSEDEELPSDCADTTPQLCLPLAPTGRGQNTPWGPSLNSEGEQEEEEHSESDWSEDEDDEDWDESGEGSEVDSELWESFLCSSDPLNLFHISSSPPIEKKMVPETDVLKATRSLHIAEGESKQDNLPQPGSRTDKKVWFSEEVVVRPLVVWAFASRAARDGSCWLQMARDRDRFRRRVQMASDIISPVLQANHRVRVWERSQLT